MPFAKHIGLICALFFALSGVSAASTVYLTRSEANLLAAINSVRAAYGLRPLHADAALTRAARAHSLDELRRGYFDHGPWAARVLSFGARGPYLGENLAWGQGAVGSPASVVRMWLGSPEHRANLLRPGFTRVGLAMPDGPFQGHGDVRMITADFGGTK
jgi:uncharacterized protein YkwD